MELGIVTMILRGYNYEEVKCVAEVLVESKYVRNMEITLNSDNAYEIIKKISKEFGEDLNIGAGTVQTIEELKKVISVGAKFVLSPRKMNEEMLEYCKRHNVLAIPGSFTPSEIAESYYGGAYAVKVFPANELDLNYAKKVKEPMGEIPLMAVGGINKDNVLEAINGGYNYVGTAGGLFNKQDIKDKNKVALCQSLKSFENAIDNIG